MNVSFNGIGCIAATFKTSGKVSPGNIVKVTENGTVAACADGDEFAGVAETVSEDGYARVLLGGYAEVSYNSTAPAFGKNYFAAAAADKVEAAEAGREAIVVYLDTDGKTVGLFM